MNANLVSDLTQLLAGLKLFHQEWVSLNPLRTGHGKCGHFVYQWKLKDSPECNCSNDNQTVKHIVSDFSRRTFQGRLRNIMVLTREALDWIVTWDISL